MKTRILLMLGAITLMAVAKISAQVDKASPAPTDEASPAPVDEAPYFGNWENDRGDTLLIASDGIKVNDEKPVRYDDITEDSDESFFVLQIKEKDSSESSYFGGDFLRITFGKDPDHFIMSIYKSLPDALKQQNEVKRIEWSAPAVEEEETDQTDQTAEPKAEQTKDEEKKSDQPKADQSPEKATPPPAPLQLPARLNSSREPS